MAFTAKLVRVEHTNQPQEDHDFATHSATPQGCP